MKTFVFVCTAVRSGGDIYVVEMECVGREDALRKGAKYFNQHTELRSVDVVESLVEFRR